MAELIKAMIPLTDLLQPDWLIIIKQEQLLYINHQLLFLLYILSDCRHLVRNHLSNEMNRNGIISVEDECIVPLREDYNK